MAVRMGCEASFGTFGTSMLRTIKRNKNAHKMNAEKKTSSGRRVTESWRSIWMDGLGHDKLSKSACLRSRKRPLAWRHWRCSVQHGAVFIQVRDNHGSFSLEEKGAHKIADKAILQGT
jgi:hypothetical protein